MARAAALATSEERRAPAAGQTRAAILAATVEVIARHSLSGTTIERVAEAARVAPATVILHFRRKDALLVDVLEHLAGEFDAARRAAMAGAEADPVAALDRLIAVSFDPAVSDPAKVAVWYAFWGEAGSRSVYLEQVGGLDHGYQADLVRICAELIRRGGYARLDAAAVALGLAGTLELLWQDILVAGPGFDRAAASRTARAYLAGVFPDHFAPTPAACTQGAPA
jgi:TetR/AcrR family transcriptional regulator, transcriptional repressor of bet genes